MKGDITSYLSIYNLSPEFRIGLINSIIGALCTNSNRSRKKPRVKEEEEEGIVVRLLTVV